MDALEARTVKYGALGKADCELKTHVPEEIKAEWNAKAARLGTTPGALLADLVIVNLRGKDYLRSVLEARLDVLGHEGATSGPDSKTTALQLVEGQGK